MNRPSVLLFLLAFLTLRIPNVTTLPILTRDKEGSRSKTDSFTSVSPRNERLSSLIFPSFKSTDVASFRRHPEAEKESQRKGLQLSDSLTLSPYRNQPHLRGTWPTIDKCLRHGTDNSTHRGSHTDVVGSSSSSSSSSSSFFSHPSSLSSRRSLYPTENTYPTDTDVSTAPPIPSSLLSATDRWLSYLSFTGRGTTGTTNNNSSISSSSTSSSTVVATFNESTLFSSYTPSTSFWIGTLTGISFMSLLSTALVCTCGTQGIRIISSSTGNGNDNHTNNTNVDSNTTPSSSMNASTTIIPSSSSSSSSSTAAAAMHTNSYENSTLSSIHTPPRYHPSTKMNSPTTVNKGPIIFSRQSSLLTTNNHPNHGQGTPTPTVGSGRKPTHQIVPFHSSLTESKEQESKTMVDDEQERSNKLWFAALDPIKTVQKNGTVITEYDRALPGIHGTPLPPNYAETLYHQQIHQPDKFNFDPVPNTGTGNGLLTVSHRKLPLSVLPPDISSLTSVSSSLSSSSSSPGTKIFMRDSKRYIRTEDGSILPLSMYENSEKDKYRDNDDDDNGNAESKHSSSAPQHSHPSSHSQSTPVTTKPYPHREKDRPNASSVSHTKEDTLRHHPSSDPHDHVFSSSSSSSSSSSPSTNHDSSSSTYPPLLPSLPNSSNLRPLVRPLLSPTVPSSTKSRTATGYSTTDPTTTATTTIMRHSSAHHPEESKDNPSVSSDTDQQANDNDEEEEEAKSTHANTHDHRMYSPSYSQRSPPRNSSTTVNPRYTTSTSDAQYESKYDYDNTTTTVTDTLESPLRRGKLPLLSEDDTYPTTTNTNSIHNHRPSSSSSSSSSFSSRTSTSHSNPSLPTPRTPHPYSSDLPPSSVASSTTDNNNSNMNDNTVVSPSTTLPLYKQLFAKEAGKTLSAEAYASAAQGQVEALLHHIAALEAAMVPGAVPLHAQMEIKQLQQRNDELVQRVNNAETKVIEAETALAHAQSRAQDAETRAITAEMQLKDTHEKLNAATRRIISLEKVTAAFGVRSTVRPVVLPPSSSSSSASSSGSTEYTYDHHPTMTYPSYPNSVTVSDHGPHSASSSSSAYSLTTPNNGFFTLNGTSSSSSNGNNIFPVTGNASYGIVSTQPTTVPSLVSRPLPYSSSGSSTNPSNGTGNGLYALGHSQSQLLPSSMYMSITNNGSNPGNWVPPAINTQQVPSPPSLVSPLLSNGQFRSQMSNASSTSSASSTFTNSKFSPTADGLLINATLSSHPLNSKSSLSPSRSQSTVPSTRGRRAKEDTVSVESMNPSHTTGHHPSSAKKSRPKSAGSNLPSHTGTSVPIVPKSVYNSSAEAAASVYRTLPTPMPMLSPEVYGPPRSPNRTNMTNGQRSNNSNNHHHPTPSLTGVTRYTLATNTSETPMMINSSSMITPSSPTKNGLFYSNLNTVNNQHHPLRTQSQWTTSHLHHLPPMEQYSLPPTTTSSTNDAQSHSSHAGTKSSSLRNKVATASASASSSSSSSSQPYDDTNITTNNTRNDNDVNLPKNRKGRIVLEGKQFAPRHRRSSNSNTTADDTNEDEEDTNHLSQAPPYHTYSTRPQPSRSNRKRRDEYYDDSTNQGTTDDEHQDDEHRRENNNNYDNEKDSKDSTNSGHPSNEENQDYPSRTSNHSGHSNDVTSHPTAKSRPGVLLPPSQIRKAESRAKAVEFLDTYRNNVNSMMITTVPPTTMHGTNNQSSSYENTTTVDPSKPSTDNHSSRSVPLSTTTPSTLSTTTGGTNGNTTTASSTGTATKRLSLTNSQRDEEDTPPPSSSSSSIAPQMAVQAAKTGNTQLLGLQYKSNSWRLV